jgi:hypothetical protein
LQNCEVVDSVRCGIDLCCGSCPSLAQAAAMARVALADVLAALNERIGRAPAS